MNNITVFSKKAIVFDLELDGLKLQIERIGDNDKLHYHRNSINIEPNYAFWWGIKESKNNEVPELGEFYAMFRAAYGESSCIYDEWKGDFSFEFKVTLVNVDEQASYLLNAVNLRDCVEFKFRKILDPEDKRFDRGLVFAPFEHEFPRTLMDGVSAFLFRYAKALWESFPQNTPEFIKRVESNLVLYGYENGQFFHNQYESHEDYWEALNTWKLNHP